MFTIAPELRSVCGTSIDVSILFNLWEQEYSVAEDLFARVQADFRFAKLNLIEKEWEK